MAERMFLAESRHSPEAPAERELFPKTSLPNTPAKASPPATLRDYGAGPGAAATLMPVPHGHGELTWPLQGPTS